MEKIKINEIPTLVKNGELSLKKACNRIWEDIYFKKNWYNLKNLNEDQISDFLLDSQKKFPQIINSYNPGTLEFRCYVYSCIHFLKIKWLKKYFEKQEEEKNIEYVIKGENCLAAEPTSLQDEVFEMPKTEQNQQTETKAESKKIKMAKLAVLILACKSCHEIDESLISKVANFTGMGIEELEEKIANLNKATVEKSDRRDLLIARRNKAFYNQKKYFIKMQKEDCDSQTYEELKKKYEMQSEIWKKQNERLNKKFVLSPTNTKIAEELGIDRRKIYFCINHTKSEEYLEFFKKLVRDEDEKNDDKKES